MWKEKLTEAVDLCSSDKKTSHQLICIQALFICVKHSNKKKNSICCQHLFLLLFWGSGFTAQGVVCGTKGGRKMKKSCFCRATERGAQRKRYHIMLFPHAELSRFAGPQWVLLKITPGWRREDSSPLSICIFLCFVSPSCPPYFLPLLAGDQTQQCLQPPKPGT